MKVYTHYQFIAGRNTGYRWRTLLQFGSSWEIIGSVVMKNPGSANFKYGDTIWIEDPELLSQLSAFDYPMDKGKNWTEFNSDPTLDCVAELFALYKNVQDKSQLSGVIQIFNLFYLKNPDLDKAIKAYQELPTNDIIFEQDICHLKQPVYLGYGKLGHSSQFRGKAERYFSEAIDKHNAKYLDPNFNANKFTHPLALMRFCKYSPTSERLRKQFFSNSLSPTNT